MREILVNALIHRDSSGAVSLAVFDDRVEVWGAGTFPSGITPESLTRPHLSVQRNPINAEVFHRAGLIEKWGCGTNRVAEMCRAAGSPPPVFEMTVPEKPRSFAEPLLQDLPAQGLVRHVENALNVAYTVWNAVVLADALGEERYPADARHRMGIDPAALVLVETLDLPQARPVRRQREAHRDLRGPQDRGRLQRTGQTPARRRGRVRGRVGGRTPAAHQPSDPQGNVSEGTRAHHGES